MSGYVMLATLIAGIVTFLIRAFPFILLRNQTELSQTVEFIRDQLPKAIMVILVIYCLKDISFKQVPYGFPALVSILTVIGLHIWKKNTLLSIFLPTALYMVLIQMIF